MPLEWDQSFPSLHLLFTFPVSSFLAIPHLGVFICEQRVTVFLNRQAALQTVGEVACRKDGCLELPGVCLLPSALKEAWGGQVRAV